MAAGSMWQMTGTTDADGGVAVPPDKQMALRYAGTCSVCGGLIDKGVRAVYSPASKTVRHIACPELVGMSPPDAGLAGASARREYERRTANDQAHIQQQRDRVQAVFGQGFVGRVAARIAVDDRPRTSTTVWQQGAVGEERVAAKLAELAEFGVITLNDRRIPGSRANIDHIAITPWGVWVIDAKRYVGKRPDMFIDGGLFGIGGVARLKVGGRNADHLVDGVLK